MYKSFKSSIIWFEIKPIRGTIESLESVDFQGFFIWCVSKMCHSFPLSTTLFDTQKTHRMTHKMRDGAVTLPAHFLKKNLEFLTHVDTHDTQPVRQHFTVTVPAHLVKKNSFFRFFSLLPTSLLTHTLTHTMACSLTTDYSTFKSVIL